MTWALETLGRRVFLVGSDSVFPHTVNAIIRHVTGAMGGEVVGEAYAPLGSRDFAAAVDSIGRARPDVILNTIVGNGNGAFFRALRQAGITPKTIPTVSFGFAEPAIAAIGATDLAGDYGAWSYFQSIDSPENRRFVEGIRRRLGPNAAVSDPMEAAYVSVHLWARAVQDAETTESTAVLAALGNQSFAAPQGVVYVDAATHHTWKAARIGRIRADGQFDIVWESGRPVRPTPFPAYRTRAEWDDFLRALSSRWGGRWLNEEVGASGGAR